MRDRLEARRDGNEAEVIFANRCLLDGIAIVAAKASVQDLLETPPAEVLPKEFTIDLKVMLNGEVTGIDIKRRNSPFRRMYENTRIEKALALPYKCLMVELIKDKNTYGWASFEDMREQPVLPAPPWFYSYDGARQVRYWPPGAWKNGLPWEEEEVRQFTIFGTALAK